MEGRQRTGSDPDDGRTPPHTQIAVVGALAIVALVIIIIVSLTVTRRTPNTGDPTPPPEPTIPTGAEIFSGGLYADQLNHAVETEQQLHALGDTETADLISEISSKPTAIWLGDQ